MNITGNDLVNAILASAEADRQAEIINLERNIKSLRNQADALEARKAELIQVLANLTN